MNEWGVESGHIVTEGYFWLLSFFIVAVVFLNDMRCQTSLSFKVEKIAFNQSCRFCFLSLSRWRTQRISSSLPPFPLPRSLAAVGQADAVNKTSAWADKGWFSPIFDCYECIFSHVGLQKNNKTKNTPKTQIEPMQPPTKCVAKIFWRWPLLFCN